MEEVAKVLNSEIAHLSSTDGWLLEDKALHHYPAIAAFP
jgi:hypothetical protein